MYLLLVCLPLLSFLLCCGFGRFFGYRGSPILATVCVALSALLSILAFYEVGICGSPCYLDFAPWFHSELFDASWGFLFDSLTVVMLVVVTVVSTLTYVFNCIYGSRSTFTTFYVLLVYFHLFYVNACYCK